MSITSGASEAIKTVYFGVDYAIREHDKIIEKSGGMSGINNPGQLESSLTHLQNDDYYPEFVDKLTYLIFALVKFHVFSDGNKRSSIALGAHFLEINSYRITKKFVLEMENIVVWLAENKIKEELLKDLIESLIYEDNYNEGLKLRLFLAVSDP
jgi:death on curing protein